MEDIMKTLIAAFTLAILFGSPALVQLANAAPPMDDARMKALQECGAMEKKYTQETWVSNSLIRTGPVWRNVASRNSANLEN
jgi:hypothetical protein